MTKKSKVLDIAPDIVNIAAAETLTAEHIRALRANPLAAYALSPVIAEAIKRDCRIPVFSDLRRASEYAAIKRKRRNGRITAVIPNYNYSRYICDAVNSLLTQTKRIDEIIIVDDCSTDDSAEIIRAHFHDVTRLRLIVLDSNSGNVGRPRNVGIAAARGEYIITLDSDDMLEPEYAETLYTAITARPDVGVTYAGVQTLIDATGERVIHYGWPVDFDWKWSMSREPDKSPHNCIPTASLFRRDMWERAGGYDEGRRSAEDAEFWTRGLATGYNALKATPEPLFIYRRHGESMSARGIHPLGTWSTLYRGWKPLAAPTNQAPVIRDYTEPVISVIIPVGPTHGAHLPTAIMSVLAQTFTAWEVIAVNDTGETLPLAPYPFVRVIDTAEPYSGAGAARNAGIKAARGALVYFLDADDYIAPETLERMARRYARGDAGYIYSGWTFIYSYSRPGVDNIAGAWEPGAWLSYESRGLHGVSVLMAREDAQRIGGFDESMRSFEDWEFFARCTIAGLCGAAVPEPLLKYRIQTGARREKGLAERDSVIEYLRREHGDYIEGRKPIMSCCGGNKTASELASKALTPERLIPMLEDSGKVLMRYIGPHEGPVTYYGKYVGCKSCEPIEALPVDVERLQNTGLWTLVREEPAHSPIMPAIYPSAVISMEPAESRSAAPVAPVEERERQALEAES